MGSASDLLWWQHRRRIRGLNDLRARDRAPLSGRLAPAWCGLSMAGAYSHSSSPLFEGIVRREWGERGKLAR